MFFKSVVEYEDEDEDEDGEVEEESDESAEKFSDDEESPPEVMSATEEFLYWAKRSTTENSCRLILFLWEAIALSIP